MSTLNTEILTHGVEDDLREAVIPFQFDSPTEDNFIRLLPSAPWPLEIVSCIVATQSGTCHLNLFRDDANQLGMTAVSGAALVNSDGTFRAQSGAWQSYDVASNGDVASGENIKVIVETLETTNVNYVQGQILIRRKRT